MTPNSLRDVTLSRIDNSSITPVRAHFKTEVWAVSRFIGLIDDSSYPLKLSEYAEVSSHIAHKKPLVPTFHKSGTQKLHAFSCVVT